MMYMLLEFAKTIVQNNSPENIQIPSNIFLIGLMGAGKTTIGRALTVNRTDCAGRRRGWRYDRIRGGLLYARRARLPVRAPALGADRYIDLMRSDKKVKAGQIHCIVLKNLGTAYLIPVSLIDLKNCLEVIS